MQKHRQRRQTTDTSERAVAAVAAVVGQGGKCITDRPIQTDCGLLLRTLCSTHTDMNAGGNLRLLQALAAGLPVMYKATARLVRYSNSGVCARAFVHKHCTTFPLAWGLKKHASSVCCHAQCTARPWSIDCHTASPSTCLLYALYLLWFDRGCYNCYCCRWRFIQTQEFFVQTLR